jgi:hypothetical protein
MNRYTLVYDMEDIYDSFFVQKQVPTLSRKHELHELVNDMGAKAQSDLTKITGLTAKTDEWDSCIFYNDKKALLGYMLLKKKDNACVISDIFVEEADSWRDAFLIMLSRAIRDMDLGSGFGKQLHIELGNSDMYYLCLEFLGEGTVLL